MRVKITTGSFPVIDSLPNSPKLLWIMSKIIPGAWYFFRRPLESPFAFQLLSLSFLVFFVTSFRPPQLSMYGERFGEGMMRERPAFPILEVGFFANKSGVNTAGLREVLVEDEDGNLTRVIQPRMRESVITYIVRSGDNISKIAHKFGLKLSTLLWANNLTVKQSVHVGQKVRIPPVDGVFYKVQPQDVLSDIAKAHQVVLDKIFDYNAIKKYSVLKVGQEIFLPYAQKTFVPQKAFTQGSNKYYIESIGFRLRRPTIGILTQGFHRSHYALDIANKLNSPIYASADGVVVKSASGWNYGFGKYIIVDHGNGVQTLYGHNNVLKVQVGDRVKAGELIALMGNTGKVWGPTGVHLHFELHIRGRKVNPWNYF